MITNIIVLLSVVLALAFLAAWLLRPELRAWIERPKYGFQERLRRYDRLRGEQSSPRGSSSE